jgi:hypothetical protein
MRRVDALLAHMDMVAVDVDTFPFQQVRHWGPQPNSLGTWHFDVRLSSGAVKRVIVPHQTYRVARERVMTWATKHAATRVSLVPRDKAVER